MTEMPVDNFAVDVFAEPEGVQSLGLLQYLWDKYVAMLLREGPYSNIETVPAKRFIVWATQYLAEHPPTPLPFQAGSGASLVQFDDKTVASLGEIKPPRT